MQVHIKYRVHGLLEQPLIAGSIVELDDATALELLRQGVAEELPSMILAEPSLADPELQARCEDLQQAYKAERQHSTELEQEVFRLRDENTALKKQGEKLSAALQKTGKKSAEQSPPAGDA